MDLPSLTIGGVARNAGVGLETVRYYEQWGLIEQLRKADGSYRRYGSKHVRSICFVKRTRELGFTLEEVKTLLQLQDSANRDEVRQIALARFEQIRARMTDLRRIERALRHLIGECETVPNHRYAQQAECAENAYWWDTRGGLTCVFGRYF